MMVMNNAHDLTRNHNVPVDHGVTLEPFLHQVSGHATMMCLNETTVCKPLNYREHFFYKSLPPDILQFTPQFKGIVDVNIEETADGNITLTAYPHEPENESEKSSQEICKREEETTAKPTTMNQSFSPRSLSRTSCKRIRLKRTGSLCVDSVVGEEDCSGDLSSSPLINPWIFKVHKEGLKRHLRSSNKVVKKCILLENVASQFRRPCVLDLKMGTRVYGDHDDDDKKLRQEKKCASTTTHKFGFRLSGMQVFNTNSGKFICHDKYYGRKLDEVGLRDALHQFFHDGQRIRRELLLPVLSRLRSMRAILERLRSFRFYASSLLIMYDGDDKCGCVRTRPESSSRSIDLLSSDQPRQSRSDTDLDTNRGLSHLNNVEKSCFDAVRKVDSYKEKIFSRSKSPSPSISDNKQRLATPSKYYNDVQDEGSRVHVDIRMIDFAKSTHQDMEDNKVVHDGPDHGYIFGLTNLITLLMEIYNPLTEDQDACS